MATVASSPTPTDREPPTDSSRVEDRVDTYVYISLSALGQSLNRRTCRASRAVPPSPATEDREDSTKRVVT